MLKEATHLRVDNGVVVVKTRPLRLSLIASLPFLMLFSALTGCLQGRSKKAAVEALNQAFKNDPLVLWVSVGRISNQCTPLVDLNQTPELTNAVRYRAALQARLINISSEGPGFWKLDLVNPGPRVARILAKGHHFTDAGCDYEDIPLPVASKSVVDLINLQPITNEKSDAVFTWKWVLEPYGVKLVDSLSGHERLELAPEIVRLMPPLHQSTFNLGDMTASTEPHQDKETLKKSGDGWVIDK